MEMEFKSHRKNVEPARLGRTLCSHPKPDALAYGRKQPVTPPSRRRTTRASAIPAARHTATAALGHGAAVEAHGGEQATVELRAAAEDVVDVGLVPEGRNFIITLVFNYKYMRFIVITILFSD